MTALQNSNNNRNVIPDIFKHTRCCNTYYLLHSTETIGFIKVYPKVARTRTAPAGTVGLFLAKKYV